MDYLTEWKKFLLNETENFLSKNIKILLKDPEFVKQYERMFLFSSDELPKNKKSKLKKIAKDLSKIPIVKNNKIEKFLGKGMFGYAYLLDNDHVLKLYFIERNDDKAFYKSKKDKAFSGRASPSDLMVYEEGSTEFINFVQMAKLMTLDEFESMRLNTPREEVYLTSPVMRLLDEMVVHPTQYLKNEVVKLERSNQPVDKDSIRSIMKKIVFNENINISKKYFNIILDLVVRQYNDGGWKALTDIHSGNIGVLPQSISLDKPIFVVFDP